jgi:8-oxo-dGTP diphosphatase
MSGPVRRVTRISAYALCLDGDRILLSHIRPGYFFGEDGGWTLPGGGLEFGESPAEAALRELAEETGLIGEITALAAVLSATTTYLDSSDGRTVEHHGIQVLYHARILSGELRNEPDGSTDEAAWISRPEAATMPLVDLAQEGVRLAFGES